MKNAFNIMKNHMETLYDSTCTISESCLQAGVINSYTRRTIGENIPCRLSYKNASPTSESSTVATVSQSIKLFLQSEVEVKAGCRIDVLHKGVIKGFKASGIPKVYSSHQEIELISQEERG